MGKRRCVGLIAICNSYLVRSKTGGSIALRNVTAQIYKKIIRSLFMAWGMGVCFRVVFLRKWKILF